MTNIIVSGAGSTEVNGTYAVIGEEGGKPIYANNDIYIIWIEWIEGWILGNVSNNFIYYVSIDDVATPDLCTTWEVYDGEPPAPTVTKEVTGVPKHFLYYARMRGN